MRIIFLWPYLTCLDLFLLVFKLLVPNDLIIVLLSSHDLGKHLFILSTQSMDELNAYQQFFLIRIYDSQPTVVFFLVGGERRAGNLFKSRGDPELSI